jgi:4-amino-4-deoxy-L-arabinose transferase-like glycosyltransferase
MWLVGVILLAFCFQAMLTLPKLTATNDEAVHLAAGYSYWQTRDFRMNQEHPPLAKLIAAFPLLFIGPKLDTTNENRKTGSQYQFGFDFLYQNDADRLLFWSRTAMVALAALGLLVTFLWARDLFGLEAGFFAAGFYAFSPNLLAHGMLVTTDVPLAVFSLLTLYLFWKRRDLYSGLALGAAMASKFSGAFLPFLIVVLCLARDRRAAFKRLLIMGTASLLVIEAAYLFSQVPSVYFRDGMLVNVKVVPDYPFYLLGELKPRGWWYYFLIAFAVKATIPTLLLIPAALVDMKNGLIDRWGEVILISGILFYVILNSVGASQIGLRYLLPMFPLLFVWTSRVVKHLAASRSGIAAIAVLLLWQAWAAIHAFPNYIPYFNEFAGGAAGGPAVLDDSNVDWGQGVKQAAEYVRAHDLQNVNMYTFSPFDNPPYYGLPTNIPPSEAFQRLAVGHPARGVYIISAHYVTRLKTVSPAWRTYTPIDRVGESLWVYAF